MFRKPEPPSLSKIPSKSGETEKERAKREKKEKSEQDKREKARREEEKKEKKKKDKELKSFGVSALYLFTVTGVLTSLSLVMFLSGGTWFRLLLHVYTDLQGSIIWLKLSLVIFRSVGASLRLLLHVYTNV